MNIKPLPLLPPKFEGKRSIFQVFKERKSSREFSSKELPLQTISDLLWAANGVNRPDSDHKTAPSAMNTQEIDIYLAKAEGLYLFDAKQTILVPIVEEDMRALTGFQPFVKDAPLNLGSVPKRFFCRFSSSFESIFDSNGRDHIHFIYDPCHWNRKSTKIISKATKQSFRYTP